MAEIRCNQCDSSFRTNDDLFFHHFDRHDPRPQCSVHMLKFATQEEQMAHFRDRTQHEPNPLLGT